ncbi:hypothetical protein CRM22_010002, partial [Opisthorchis felineus]
MHSTPDFTLPDFGGLNSESITIVEEFVIYLIRSSRLDARRACMQTHTAKEFRFRSYFNIRGNLFVKHVTAVQLVIHV